MRTRICLYVLLFVPLAVYWQTIFPSYGLGKDYSALRQAQEEPGRLVRESGAMGAPVRGALLETTFSAFSEVDQLKWVRLAAVILMTVLGVAIWRQLYASNWSEVRAAVVGLGLVLLPSAQMLVAWSSHWPAVLTLLLALAGFSAIETEIERGGLKRVVALVGGCMIYTAAGLVDQVNVLFAVVVFTAILLARTGREPLKDIWWCAFHVVTIAAGLALSRLFSRVLEAQGIFYAEASDATTAVAWTDYLQFPLPNALGLYALNDDNGHGAVIYWTMIVAVVAVLGFAYRKARASDDKLAAPRLALAAALLAATTITVCAISESPTSYRMLFPLAGLVLVLVVHAVGVLLGGYKIRRFHYAALFVVVAAGAALASRSAFLLVGQPQAREWEILNGAVLRASFAKPVRVHIVKPSASDRSTDRIYRDEFGSVSSSDEAIVQDMFKSALQSRFQGRLPAGSGYVISTGYGDAEPGSFDLLIDMRRLAGFRH